jgi:hypothetical protein
MNISVREIRAQRLSEATARMQVPLWPGDCEPKNAEALLLAVEPRDLAQARIYYYLCLRNDFSNVSYSSVCLPASRFSPTSGAQLKAVTLEPGAAREPDKTQPNRAGMRAALNITSVRI